MSRYPKTPDIARLMRETEGAGELLEELDTPMVCAMGLEHAARVGAQVILQVALEQEVTEFLGRKRYERSEEAEPGYRNGGRRRRLTTGSGPVEVRVPKVTGAEEPFRVKSLRAYQRTSEAIQEAIPQLYAEGLSTRDFSRALGGLWKEAGLSRSSISRANKQLYEAFRAWRKRDLSGVKVLYLFLDAVNERVRAGSREKEGVLVAHALLEDGSRELLSIQIGPRESEGAWREVLEDLISRGLAPPSLVISDGAKGLIAAVKKTWPSVPRQRCTAHKSRNVIERIPRKHQERVKKDLSKIFHAPSLDEGKRAADRFFAKYSDEFPTACLVLASDLEDCLVFYRFPEAHWKRIRTSNVIERTFKEVRRRTRVVGRFPNETSALVLIWATVEERRMKWRGVRMNDQILKEAVSAAHELSKHPIRIRSAERIRKAA